MTKQIFKIEGHLVDKYFGAGHAFAAINRAAVEISGSPNLANSRPGSAPRINS